MEGFEIRKGFDFIHIWPEEIFGFPDHTSHYGGYEARGQVEICCGFYRVRGPLWFSTGEVWQFYTELLKAYNDLDGMAQFKSSEDNLVFAVTFKSDGHMALKGKYQENPAYETWLQFEVRSDQSYLIEPLAQLAAIVAHYGDMRGVAQE